MEKVFAQWINTKIVETKYWEIIKVWVKVEEFKTFLDIYDKGWWVNLNLMTSKDWTKKYFELDTWVSDKPKAESKKNEFWDEVLNSISF